LAAQEFAVRASMLQVGSVLLGQLLNSDHGGHQGPRIPCGHHHQADFVDYRTKPLQTLLGRVALRRAYYHCGTCADTDGRGVIPKDRELDIVGTSFSPGLRRLMARTGGQEPFDAARRDLAELAAITVDTKAVERITEGVGTTIEALNRTERTAIVTDTVHPIASAARLYIAMDGTGVPCVPRETQGRTGKQPDGGAKTREAKLGCVFTQTTVDAQGYPLRDPHSTTYVGAIETAEEFGPRLHAEALRRGLTRQSEVVVLGDGALWIWHLAQQYFPAAVHVVDLYHAREHLGNVAKLVFAPHSKESKDWVAARHTELDAGEVDVIIAAIKELAAHAPRVRDELRQQAEYFETNTLRMCYKYFRAQGFFVGSGVVEAGCKTVIGHRLKQSGMRWTVAGANAVIALRCQLLSDRWEEVWSRLRFAA
jgi:hypothetical protein